MMRRLPRTGSLRPTLAALASLLLLSCDEGPAQVYAPSPAGAGGVWNDGKGGGSNDPTKTGFGGVGGGTNKMELCTGPEKHARWAAMVQMPIIPPTQGAGLDMSGGADWHGLSIEEAEKINCQSDNQGDFFGDGNQANSWGDNAEVTAEYLVSNRKIQQLSFWPGYQGTCKFHSPDGKHSYEIGIGTQIQKDGLPLTVDWLDQTKFRAFADEMYRGMMATFAPQLPVEPAGVNCLDSGLCQALNFGDVAAWFVNPLNWGFWIESQNAQQPVPSIPNRIDQIFIKLLEFAYLPPLLKLDAEGPVATQKTPLGKSKVPCVMKFGQTYQDFVATCVTVTGDAKLDAIELNKLLGGLAHSTERFAFDLVGVDVNFTDLALPPNDVVHDTDRPQPTDTVTEVSCDQSTLGNIANDWDASGTVHDLHGAGAVYKEYARLVRENLLAQAGIPDGDPKLCLWPEPLPRNFDPAAFEQNLPAHCTGFEGFVTAAPPVNKKDLTNLGPEVLKVSGTLALGLKPGSTQAVWCMDPTGTAGLKSGAGFTACAAPHGAQGGIWSTSFNRALRFFGKNKLGNMPVDVQDYRFFWKMYVQALLKYLLVANNTSVVPDLTPIKIDQDNLFYDSLGSGQFEQAEYIDRRFVARAANGLPAVDPTDLIISADVKNGIFNAFGFSRDLLRGETIVYEAMLEKRANAPGKEDTALLTNIFGSPVLKNGWLDSSGGKSAYYCATTLDPNNCDNQLPPLDANGNLALDPQGLPLLSRYKGAFGGNTTVFNLGESPIKITQTFPNIESAMVDIPTTPNPYDPTTKPLRILSTLVPWVPNQAASGFSIPQNGGIDKFIQAAQLDFTGNTISGNVYYNDVLDMNHAPTGALRLLAVETTDFLGDVFLCQDAATGDILSARMYTPVGYIVAWLKAHPSAYDSCGMIVRFSPFNNFVDFITSLTNGVRLNVTQGGGFGRVVDATLFIPGQ